MAFANEKTLNEFLNPKPKSEKKEKDDGLGDWKRLAKKLEQLGK